MRLRQVALVAQALAPAQAALCEVLGIEVSVHDPGVAVFGLENAVMPVGDTFLEVVSPAREGTSAGRLLARRGGDSGYMVIVQSDDLAADRRRLEQHGVRVVWETALDDIATIHLHPRDLGGAIVSLDEARPPGSWRWAGPDWPAYVRTERVREIAGVELQADDPAAMAARWAAVLGRGARPLGERRFEIALDRGAIRFAPLRDSRGEGVRSVEIWATDAGAVRAAARERGALEEDGSVRLCGTFFTLREG